MKDIVTFEIAKKLKEKGYPQHWSNNDYIVENEYEDNFEVGSYYDRCLIPEHITTIAAPMIFEVVNWLLDKKKIFLTVDFEPKGFLFIVNSNIKFNYEDVYEFDIFESNCTFSNPQEAYKEGIKYIIDKLI